jgi:hypothetical protein
MDIKRMMDDMSLDIPEVTVKLFDALTDYVRTIEEYVNDPVNPAEFLKPHLAECRKLLDDLKGWEVDGTLGGILGKPPRTD